MTAPDAGVRSAQGEDRSSYQAVLPWTGLDFGICKATEGTDWYDPAFAANWANLAKAGIPRGAYAFFHPALDPVAQARWFMARVKAQGLKPGDMLVADVEILVGADGALVMSGKAARRSHLLTAGMNGRAFPRAAVIGKHEIATTGTVPVGIAAAAFLAEARSLAGPHNPVLCYTDLSVGASLGACTGHDLWIAFYASTAPASVAPWKNWRIWQYAGGGGTGGSDRNGYNGTAAQLRAWIASYLPQPAPVQPTYPEDEVPTFASLTSDHHTWVSPLVPAGKKTLLLSADAPAVLRVAFGGPGVFEMVDGGKLTVQWAPDGQHPGPVLVPVPAGAVKVSIGGTHATPEPPVTVDWA